MGDAWNGRSRGAAVDARARHKEASPTVTMPPTSQGPISGKGGAVNGGGGGVFRASGLGLEVHLISKMPSEDEGEELRRAEGAGEEDDEQGSASQRSCLTSCRT